ncbi:MAG: Acetyl-CoA acetyltransferase [Holosporales bacterium]
MKNVVIVAAKRTPLGAYNGQFSRFTAPQMGGYALKGVLKQNPSVSIDAVIMGCVIQAGLGQSPARQATVKADLPIHTPASTVNKVCGSAMKAVMMAVDQIKAQNAKTILAGGMESMSNAPYLLDKARFGFRVGHQTVLDAMYRDGLEDAFSTNDRKERTLMGVFADATAAKYGFTRQDQEAFATQTYQNYNNAAQHIAQEIEPILYKDHKGNDVVCDQDEPASKVLPHKFSALKPAFGSSGTVTAATSSSLADGAAALLLMDEEEAIAQGLKPLARIVGYSEFAHEPEWFTTAPVGAMKKLFAAIGWKADDVDAYEINEAFAVVPMVAMHELGIDRKKINMFGGACTMGHPIGCSGARILVTLLNVLRVNKLKRGVASACIGSGEATAIAIEIFDS